MYDQDSGAALAGDILAQSPFAVTVGVGLSLIVLQLH
jgi:hypothetical protein